MTVEGPTVAIRVTADSSGATQTFGSLATDITTATRRAASGIGGLLSATDHLYDAQQRLNVAQISYTLTVREYGAGSLQAARAHDQLAVATNGLSLAQDRLNLRYLTFALSVGPQLYGTITKVLAASQGMTVANYVETASWYAKAAAIGLTVGLLTLGIGAVMGLASGAQIQNTVNQQNSFYGSGMTGTAGQVNAIGQVTSAYRG